MKPQVRIEDWYIINNRLYGKVYDHPRAPDSSDVVSSTIVLLELNRNYCESQNTAYILGKPLKISEQNKHNDITM